MVPATLPPHHCRLSASTVTEPTGYLWGFTTQESTGFSISATADEITRVLFLLTNLNVDRVAKDFRGKHTGDFSGTGVQADPLGVIP